MSNNPDYQRIGPLDLSTSNALLLQGVNTLKEALDRGIQTGQYAAQSRAKNALADVTSLLNEAQTIDQYNSPEFQNALKQRIAEQSGWLDRDALNTLLQERPTSIEAAEMVRLENRQKRQAFEDDAYLAEALGLAAQGDYAGAAAVGKNIRSSAGIASLTNAIQDHQRFGLDIEGKQLGNANAALDYQRSLQYGDEEIELGLASKRAGIDSTYANIQDSIYRGLQAKQESRLGLQAQIAQLEQLKQGRTYYEKVGNETRQRVQLPTEQELAQYDQQIAALQGQLGDLDNAIAADRQRIEQYSLSNFRGYQEQNYGSSGSRVNLGADKSYILQNGEPVTSQNSSLRTRDDIAVTIFNAFKSYGVPDAIATAFVGEINRENGLNKKIMFGNHTDPHNKVTNTGIISFQGDRRTNLMRYMTERGFVKNGVIEQSPESVAAQVGFIMEEIKNTKAYRATKELIESGETNFNKIHEVLGDNYIRWRRKDPKYSASGYKNIRSGIATLTEALSKASPFTGPAAQVFDTAQGVSALTQVLGSTISQEAPQEPIPVQQGTSTFNFSNPSLNASNEPIAATAPLQATNPGVSSLLRTAQAVGNAVDNQIAYQQAYDNGQIIDAGNAEKWLQLARTPEQKTAAENVLEETRRENLGRSEAVHDLTDQNLIKPKPETSTKASVLNNIRDKSDFWGLGTDDNRENFEDVYEPLLKLSRGDYTAKDKEIVANAVKAIESGDTKTEKHKKAMTALASMGSNDPIKKLMDAVLSKGDTQTAVELGKLMSEGFNIDESLLNTLANSYLDNLPSDGFLTSELKSSDILLDFLRLVKQQQELRSQYVDTRIETERYKRKTEAPETPSKRK